MMRFRYWFYGCTVALLVGLFLFSQFRYQTSFPEMPLAPGTLLFVEDVLTRQGLSSFQFGDLVLYDPNTDERYVLTADGHYINDPTWGPEGRYILFASKRENPGGTRTLSETDRIHRLDLESQEIELWGRELPERFDEISESMRQPALSPDGTKIVFVSSHPDRTRLRRLVVYDKQNDSLEILVDSIGIHTPRRPFWSDDGSRFAVSATEEKGTTMEPRNLHHGYMWDFAGGTVDTFFYDEKTRTRTEPQDFLADELLLTRWRADESTTEVLLWDGEQKRLFFEVEHEEYRPISDVTVHPSGIVFYRLAEGTSSHIMRYDPARDKHTVVMEADGHQRASLTALRASHITDS